MIFNIYLFSFLFLIFLFVPVYAQDHDESQKSSESIVDIIKEKQLSNAKRETVSSIGDSLSEENKEVARALREYRENRSPESLAIIRKVLAPSSDSIMTFATLRRLPVNPDTYKLLRMFVKNDDGRYRWFAVDRLKYAPAALDMNDTQIAELIDFLNDVAANAGSSDFRLATTAQMVVKRLEETPYIETTESTRSGTRDAEAIEEPTEDSPATEFEEVAQESTAPESATEKLAEVKVPEPAEEAAEEPSQWWLWLIGLLVIVGGLGFALRRKS